MWQLSLLSLLKNNWKFLLIASVAILWSLGCYQQGRRDVRAQWDASILQATIAARQIETDNAILSGIIEGKHHESIKGIDSSFDIAVKRLQSTSSDMPCTSKTTPSSNGAASDNKLYRARKFQRLEDAKQAEINTQKLISLQQWESEVK